MALYPLASPPGPWRGRGDEVGPSGCLPEISGSSGLVKARETPSEDRGLRRVTRAFFSSSPSLGRELTEPLLRHLAAPAVPDIVLRLCLGRRLRPISTH